MGGGVLPGGDILALLPEYPGVLLLSHLPALPVLHGLLGDGVIGGALAHLVHRGLALPVGHLATGPGRHCVIDKVVFGGSLAMDVLVTLLLIEDGALPLLLGVELVVVRGGAVLVLQILVLLLTVCLWAHGGAHPVHHLGDQHHG